MYGDGSDNVVNEAVADADKAEEEGGVSIGAIDVAFAVAVD